MSFLQPAQAFEQEAGVSGISRIYLMPMGRRPSLVESNLCRFVQENGLVPYIVEGDNRDDLLRRFTRLVRGGEPREMARKHFQEIACELKILNPELRDIAFPPDSVSHLYDFILGATSGFNSDDIQHYLDCRSGIPRAEGMGDVDALHYKVFGKYPCFGGQPSPKTLSLIAGQLKEKLETSAHVPGREVFPIPTL